jgi:hypothetical protein
MLSPGLDLSQDGLSQKNAPKPGTKVNILSLITDLKFGAFEKNPAAFWVAMPGVVLGYVSTFVDSVPQSLLLHSGPISLWVNSAFLLLLSPRKPEILPQNVTFLGQITQRLMLHFPC